MGPRFVRGALFVGGASWFASAFNFLVAIAVARELGPEAFGIYALAIAVNEFINIVMGFGIAPALVQAPDERPGLFDTGYAMSFALGLVGLLIACAVAPFVWIYRSETVAIFLLLLAGARIAMLLNDVALARLDRNVRYGPIAAIDLAIRVLPNGVCLALAWRGFGPWSLILRDLLMAGLSFTLSHAWSRYRFRGRVERQEFRRIMAFSGPMFVARTMDVFLQRFDRLIVGTLLGDAAIGLYHQARFLAEAGLMATAPIMKVTFNLYSRLQGDEERLVRAYFLVNYFLTRLLFAGAATLLVFPEPIVQLLLGREWLSVAPLLRILALYAALLPLADNLKLLLYARARTRANVLLQLVQVAFFVPAVLLAGVAGSMPAVATSLLVVTACGLALASWFGADVVGPVGTGIYAVPLALLLGTTAAFWGIEAVGGFVGVPYWSKPFLPPLLFWAGIVALERRRLVGEIGYLRGQFRSSVGGSEISA